MADRVLSFHYTLKDTEGETIDSSAGGEPLAFIEGRQQIIPKLETELLNMKIGDKKHVAVGHEDAYGSYRDDLIRTVELEKMPKKDVKVGDQFEVAAGNRRTVVVVTEIKDGQVTLDGNHPLAGKDLKFDVELVEIRDATKEELSHGHVHGVGGHKH